MALTSLTSEQLLERYIAVMQNRFARPPGPSPEARDAFKAIQEQGLPALRQFAQQLLNLTLALADPGAPGPCLYVVNNVPFCFSSLTPDECAGLGGQPVLSCNGLLPWPTGAS
jgi:hypothetical protein